MSMEMSMSMEMEMFCPEDSWVSHHKQKISRMLIQDPWNDPMVKKVGLYEMYIIDALGEAMELSAEESPDTKLGCINPKYLKMHKLVSAYLDEPTTEGLQQLVSFVEEYLKRPIKLVRWVHAGLPQGPDIRVLDTPDECMSWLAQLCG